jgi:methyl-accepting chemotaxis protein
MTGSYSALGEALATRTERDRERIALAFADARDLQSTSTGATVIILMVVVVALALLSFWIIRNVLGALKAIGESAIEIAQGKIDQTIDYESSDKIGVVADAFRGLIAYIQSVAETADNLARGDISVRIEPRSDHDVLSRNMARATATLQAVLEEAGGLISAAESGQLQRRGDPGAYDGAYGELVLGMNQMLDALGVPLTEASAVLGGMARGDHDHTHAGCVRGQLR